MSAYRLVSADDPVLEHTVDRSRAWQQVAAVRHGDCWESRRRVLAALAHQPAPLDRDDRPGHLTGSALVVDPATGRILVMFHRKLQRWLQPGGHADGDANLAHVAWREATEETGIDGLRVVLPAVDIDIHEVRPPSEDAHLHLDVRFVLIAPPRAITAANEESEALRWIEPSELIELDADPGLIRLASRLRPALESIGM